MRVGLVGEQPHGVVERGGDGNRHGRDLTNRQAGRPAPRTGFTCPKRTGQCRQPGVAAVAPPRQEPGREHAEAAERVGVVRKSLATAPRRDARRSRRSAHAPATAGGRCGCSQSSRSSASSPTHRSYDRVGTGTVGGDGGARPNEHGDDRRRPESTSAQRSAGTATGRGDPTTWLDRVGRRHRSVRAIRPGDLDARTARRR